MADDFWGTRQWENFESQIKRVLPEKEFTELEMTHPVFRTVLDLQSLSYLGAFSSGIANLSGLEWATNLTTLYLAGNAITNVTNLGNLLKLRYLSLDENRITGLTPLTGLTNLEIASLNQNRYSSISSLSNLSHLSAVDVRWNLLDITNAGSAALSVIQNLQEKSVAVYFTPSLGFMILKQR